MLDHYFYFATIVGVQFSSTLLPLSWVSNLVSYENQQAYCAVTADGTTGQLLTMPYGTLRTFK